MVFTDRYCRLHKNVSWVSSEGTYLFEWFLGIVETGDIVPTNVWFFRNNRTAQSPAQLFLIGVIVTTVAIFAILRSHSTTSTVFIEFVLFLAIIAEFFCPHHIALDSFQNEFLPRFVLFVFLYRKWVSLNQSINQLQWVMLLYLISHAYTRTMHSWSNVPIPKWIVRARIDTIRVLFRIRSHCRLQWLFGQFQCPVVSYHSPWLCFIYKIIEIEREREYSSNTVITQSIEPKAVEAVYDQDSPDWRWEARLKLKHKRRNRIVPIVRLARIGYLNDLS